MELISFPEQTTTIAEDQPEYLPLPAHVFSDSEEGRIACCWRLTFKERLIVLFSGVIWHEVLTFRKSLQPQKLSTCKPIMPTNLG